MTVGSGSVNASNIKFSDLQIAYNNVCGTLALTNPISLSEFKGCEYIVSSGGGSGSQQNYIQPGSYNWTCPAGVTSVSVVCCGGGGGGLHFGNNNSVYQYAMNGGGGGGLGWKNNISVTPAQIYNVVVGAGGNQGAYSQSSTAGGDSYFINTSTVKGGGGFPGRFNSTANGGSHTGDGGGNGGKAYNQTSYSGPAGGGGAGGYSGNGGDGRQNGYSPYAAPSGGGGAGGYQLVANKVSGGGGGVGYLGEGSSGTAASEGGSGGSDGGTSGATPNFSNNGGNYGGGGGGSSSLYWDVGGDGSGGFVRIIWGDNRSYPNTNTDDQPQTNNVTYTIPTTNLSLNILKTNSFKDMSPNMTINASGLNNGGYVNTASTTLTFTSTEPTSNFDVSSITINTGTLSNFQSTDSQVNGGHKIFTVTLTFDQTSPPNLHTINVSAGTYTNSKTSIGCQNNAATQYSITYTESVSGGEKGNVDTAGSPWRLFVGSKGTGNEDSLYDFEIDLSSASYIGASLVNGNKGHVFFRYVSGTSYRQDPQLYEIDFGGTHPDTGAALGWIKVGQYINNYGWGYGEWTTTSLDGANETYNPASTWYTVTSSTSPSGRWHRDTGGTPSSGTGVAKDYHIYMEGSSPAYSKDIYLRSPEITFNTNIIKFSMYGYGVDIGKMYLGVFITA